jgi:flagellar motor protein MotB
LKRFWFPVLIFLTSFPLSGAEVPAKVRLHFDFDLAGAPPAFLRFEASPGIARSAWKAIPDKHAVTLENVAVQTARSGSPGQFRFALSTEAKDFLDGKVVVSIKRQSPGNPCRGGLAVRFRDPKNFLGVVWDFEKSDVSLVEMKKGSLRTLASGSVESNEPLWRTIGVELSGDHIRVTVSGKTAFETKDSKPSAGAAGLLTEAGAVIGFDELTLEPK